MIGFVFDALMVGAFIGVALAAAVPVFGLAMLAIGVAMAIVGAIGWFLWYSLATIITLIWE